MSRLHLAVRALGVAATLLTVGACSDTDDSARPGDDREVGSRPTAELCAAVERAQSAYWAVFDPNALALPDTQVEDAFTERRDAIAGLAELVDGDAKREVLEGLHADLEQTDPALVEALTTNRDVLEGIGMGWVHVVLTSTAVTPEQSDAYLRSRDDSWVLAHFDAACRKPELLADPPTDLEPQVESGTILYDAVGATDGGLLAVSSDGVGRAAIPAPDGWDDLADAAVAPDGRTVVAVAMRAGSEEGYGLAVGTLSDSFEVLYSDAGQLTCPRIGDDGEILVTRLGERGQPNELLSVRQGTAEVMNLPVADFYCAERLGSGDLLLGSAGDDPTSWGAVSRITGSSTDPIYEPADCNSMITGLSPDRERELVVQTCKSIEDSGLYTLDLASDSTTLLLQGRAGTARWSPTGQWVVVALAPVDRSGAESVRIWLMRADGTGLRRLTDAPSSFPAWVSDRLEQ